MSSVTWLRVSYWVGAAVDGLAAMRMLFPTTAISDEYRYALGLAAALMLGWTILLLWADRKPGERKGILLLTVFPVISGIIVAEVYAYSAGLIPLEQVMPVVGFLVLICVLFLFSYFNARRSHTTLHDASST